MFVEDYDGDVCGFHVFRPHGPGAVVVKRGAKDKAFALLFGKCVPTLWLVVDEGFHVNRDKRNGVVVVWAVHVVVGEHSGVCFRLA